jgi:O-antigen/teichoic acid export membrane protein
VVRDVLSVALSQYVARAVLLVRGVVAAATLGPFGYGGWNAINLVLDYGAYASAGVLQGLDLRLPAAVRRGDQAGARALMAGAWAVVLGGGALFAFGLVLYLAGGRRAISAPWGPLAPLLMLVAALLQLGLQFLGSVLKARGQFGAVSVALALQFLLGGGVGIALVRPYGVWGLLGAWLGGTAVACLWLRAAAPDAPLLPAHPRLGLELARAGFPIFGFFTTSLVLRSADRLALLRYAGPGELGLYSLGLMAAGLVLYLPEAAATVLFPRVAAAAGGAADAHGARLELVRAHRGVMVALPPLVGLSALWAGPIVARVLPAFQDGIPALQVLAIGALLFSIGTLPGYFLLAEGRAPRLLVAGAVAAAVTAALVFGIAARWPRAEAVAWGAAAGYALFGALVVTLAAPRLCDTVGERWRLAASSFGPVLWAGGLVLGLSWSGRHDSAPAALARSAAFVAAELPALWLFGRGVGLVRLWREWRDARLSTA